MLVLLPVGLAFEPASGRFGRVSNPGVKPLLAFLFVFVLRVDCDRDALRRAEVGPGLFLGLWAWVGAGETAARHCLCQAEPVVLLDILEKPLQSLKKISKHRNNKWTL